MFRGISSVTMDAKGRMALPARYRDAVAVASDGRIVVTIDMRESCLLLYPLAEWSCDGSGIGHRWSVIAAIHAAGFRWPKEEIGLGGSR